jgi:hypothetical protein
MPPDLPSLRSVRWSKVSAPAGLGWIALAVTRDVTVMLLAPNVLLPGMELEDVDRWRFLSASQERPFEPSLELDEAALQVPSAVSTAEVLGVCGDELRGWVRDVMRGQVRDALAFASVPAADFPDEERSRAASARMLRLHRELSEAFPFEDWYALPVPDEHTVEALIAQRPSLAAQGGAEQAKAWWPGALSEVLVRMLRRPRVRRLFLETSLRSVAEALLPESTVVEVRRKLGDGCSQADEMLPISL